MNCSGVLIYVAAVVDGASQVVLVVKNPPVKAGDVRDVGLIPGSRRSPGGRHGNSLQYSCLENPMDRETWWATVRRVPKSWTGLKQLSSHAYTTFCIPIHLLMDTSILSTVCQLYVAMCIALPVFEFF